MSRAGHSSTGGVRSYKCAVREDIKNPECWTTDD